MRLEFHSTGCDVNLVIRGEQPPAAELDLLLAVKHIHRHPVTATQTCQHLRQIILRYRKQNRDRFDLRDHHDTGRVTGAHHVALIYLPQSQLPRNWRGNSRIVHL